MRCGATILLFLLCGLRFAFADAAPLREAAPQLACDAAANAAENAAGLPANLLVSVGVVESGRVDRATGLVGGWPWTVNVDGAGHYFGTEPDAAAFAQAAQAAGARDVDVGCFQISLESHPGAFRSLDSAFDPATNANFAAYFLNELKTRTGSWDAAIADYHSASPELGLPYRSRVLAAWQGIGGAPAEMSPAIFELPDPAVIQQAPAARRVRVITMDMGGWAAPDHAGLPRVITP